MIVTIEYELPEDEEDYKAAIFGPQMWRALKKLEKRIREEMKYKTMNSPEHYMELYYEILNEEGLNLD